MCSLCVQLLVDTLNAQDQIFILQIFLVQNSSVMEIPQFTELLEISTA